MDSEAAPWWKRKNYLAAGVVLMSFGGIALRLAYSWPGISFSVFATIGVGTLLGGWFVLAPSFGDWIKSGLDSLLAILKKCKDTRDTRRATLAVGVLLFVFNVFPRSPLNDLTSSERQLYATRIALGYGAVRNGGYYWSNTSVLLAAVGAAVAALAIVKSKRDGF